MVINYFLESLNIIIFEKYALVKNSILLVYLIYGAGGLQKENEMGMVVILLKAYGKIGFERIKALAERILDVEAEDAQVVMLNYLN